MSQTRFDEAAWIKNLGVALEHLAATATPQYHSQTIQVLGPLPHKIAESSRLREYRQLAERAKHDSKALQQFQESRLWIRTDPVEARAILREHPIVKRFLNISDSMERVVIKILNSGYGSELNLLVNSLAKMSVKEGGVGAASRLNRFLKTVEDKCIPADEIIVFHGLTVKKPLDLGQGAYIAPYETARLKFDLPVEPEPFQSTSTPNAAALVRSIECGPDVDTPGLSNALPNTTANYCFPNNYKIPLEDWFDEYKFLVDILSIATRVPLITRTRYIQFHDWIREIDPNLSHYYLTSGGYTSDIWPKGRVVLNGDIETFIALTGDWYSQTNKQYALKFAIRRLASSFSRPGGRFGTEDRILDVAIALEIIYGRKTGKKLAKRAARLLGACTKEQIQTFDSAMRFYDMRSKIVHSKHLQSNQESLYDELKSGQDLACRSLSSVLKHYVPVDWSCVEPLYTETLEHIHNFERLKQHP